MAYQGYDICAATSTARVSYVCRVSCFPCQHYWCMTQNVLSTAKLQLTLLVTHA